MPNQRLRLLLADTNILIDLIHAGRLEWLSILHNALELEIFVADCAKDELSKETLCAPLESFGLTVIQTKNDLILQASVADAQAKTPALSAQDITQLIIAKRHGWTLWTNDKRLLREAERENVSHCTLFEPFTQAVAQRALSKQELLAIAEDLLGENNQKRLAQLKEALAMLA